MRRVSVNMAAFAFFGGMTTIYGKGIQDPLFWYGMLCLLVVQVNSIIGD